MFNRSPCGPFARQFLILGIVTLSLSACSTSKHTAESGITDAFDAATGNLEDLNIKRREIPKLLEKLAANPYQPPPKYTCKSIKSELAELEPLIGPDIQPREVQVASSDGFIPDLENIEMPAQAEVENSAHDAVMGLIRSQTDFLPFRSIIRRLSGADRHEKNLQEAYQAGKLRRAYLKGLAESKFGKKCNTYSTLPIPLPKPKTEPSA